MSKENEALMSLSKEGTNMETQDRQVTFGRRPEEIVERNAGGLDYRAMMLCELRGAAEAVAGEFAYDDEGASLVRLCGELDELLKGLFLDANARLTLTMECPACGGQGFYNRRQGEPVQCEECGGTGGMPNER